MNKQLAILFFAAFLFVVQAVPTSNDFDDDDDDDVVDETERADQNDVGDLSKLTAEELKDIVQRVQEDLRRAVDEMGSEQVEVVENGDKLERRLLNYKLGKGWSVGTKGLSWQNRRRTMRFNVKPTFSGFKPSGFRAGFTWRF